MQTILGSNGAIGTLLSHYLKDYTDKIRLVSRLPQRTEEEVFEPFSADITDPVQTERAIEGSSVVYLTIGLKYDRDIWRKKWPKIMTNVIEACKKYDAKLVFFDNVYMYSADSIKHMTEDAHIDPPSEKGKVRKEIAEQLLEEFSKGELKGCIARSADFYGPDAENGILNVMAIANFKNGKAANWLGDIHKKHSFTFTKDAARATAILGNEDKANGQVWHLPTAPDPWTGEEYINFIADQYGVKAKKQVAGRTIVKIMGWFKPIMKELHEMIYQYESDYIFDSSKFEKEFNFKPTSYEEGIKASL